MLCASKCQKGRFYAVRPAPFRTAITNYNEYQYTMFPLVIAAIPWLLLLLTLYLLLTEPPRELDSASWRSSFLFLIGRVPLRACVRRQGVLSTGWVVEDDGKVKMEENIKRTLSAVWRGWKLDPDTFAKYCQACGISPPKNPGIESASDPFLYPETLFLRHMIAIVTNSSFPVSPLGLIHVRQTVETRCALNDLLSTRCDLCCLVSDIRATEKGYEIDMKCDVYNASGGILWSAVTTLLSRNNATVNKQSKSSRLQEASQPFSGTINSYTGKYLEVTDDTGLRYAAATGDYNPHHLYPWMARLLGYKQPIVHGMWTLAKALAAIQAGTQPPHHAGLVMKATFKKPLFIPAKCVILYTRLIKDGVTFEVRDAEGTVLHVTGTITYT